MLLHLLARRSGIAGYRRAAFRGLFSDSNISGDAAKLGFCFAFCGEYATERREWIYVWPSRALLLLRSSSLRMSQTKRPAHTEAADPLYLILSLQAIPMMQRREHHRWTLPLGMSTLGPSAGVVPTTRFSHLRHPKSRAKVGCSLRPPPPAIYEDFSDCVSALIANVEIGKALVQGRLTMTTARETDWCLPRSA